MPIPFVIDATNANGTQVIPSPGTGFRIRVVKYMLTTKTDIGIKWQSGSTDLSGVSWFGANGGVNTETNLVCGKGKALNIHLSAGSAVVGGHGEYVKEKIR